MDRIRNDRNTRNRLHKLVDRPNKKIKFKVAKEDNIRKRMLEMELQECRCRVRRRRREMGMINGDSRVTKELAESGQE